MLLEGSTFDIFKKLENWLKRQPFEILEINKVYFTIPFFQVDQKYVE